MRERASTAHGDGAEKPSVARDENLGCGLDAGGQVRGYHDTAVSQQQPAADKDGYAANDGGNAAPRSVIKPLGLEYAAALCTRMGDDSLAERMLGAHFGGGRTLQDRLR
jgi:hypothetical protein